MDKEELKQEEIVEEAVKEEKPKKKANKKEELEKAIAEAEADLAAAVDQLQAAYIDGDSEAVKQLCRRVSALLAERNRLCKLNKN